MCLTPLAAGFHRLELPNAKLVLYSDAGHAFLFQHLDDFSREVTSFLAD